MAHDLPGENAVVTQTEAPTGVNVTENLPTLPGQQPGANAPVSVPSFWDDPQRVLKVVFAIAEFDPQAAAELWHEYKRLSGH